MSKVLAIEVSVRESDETYFANYVYDNHEDQYKHDSDTLSRINCVPPNVNYESVVREARKHARASNVKLIDHIKLQAQVPFVESLALMQKGN